MLLKIDIIVKDLIIMTITIKTDFFIKTIMSYFYQNQIDNNY